MKSILASRGALDETAPYTRWGYFIRNQAAKDPGYDPPNTIHLTFLFNLSFLFIASMKFAKSAKACCDDKNCKFFTLKSLKTQILNNINW